MYTTIEDAKKLVVQAHIRYEDFWDGATVNSVEDIGGKLIPCREGDNWCPVIEISTGIIENWEKGKTATIRYKIADCGNYTLLNGNGEVIAELYNDYVPSTLRPTNEIGDDYIDLVVDENGQIQNWNGDLSDFEKEFDDYWECCWECCDDDYDDCCD